MPGKKFGAALLSLAVAACADKVEPTHPVFPPVQITPTQVQLQPVPEALSMTGPVSTWGSHSFRAIPYDERCSAVGRFLEEFGSSHLNGVRFEVGRCASAPSGDTMFYDLGLRVWSTTESGKDYSLHMELPRTGDGLFEVQLSDGGEQGWACQQAPHGVKDCALLDDLRLLARRLGGNADHLLPTLLAWVTDAEVNERIYGMTYADFFGKTVEFFNGNGEMSGFGLSLDPERDERWCGRASIRSAAAGMFAPQRPVLGCLTSRCLEEISALTYCLAGEWLVLERQDMNVNHAIRLERF